jgi:hypothetical protein
MANVPLPFIAQFKKITSLIQKYRLIGLKNHDVGNRIERLPRAT